MRYLELLLLLLLLLFLLLLLLLLLLLGFDRGLWPFGEKETLEALAGENWKRQQAHGLIHLCMRKP